VSGDQVRQGLALFYRVFIHKWLFRPISASGSKFYPRNINYMPVVKFFACLDLNQNSSFLDGHEDRNSPQHIEIQRLCIGSQIAPQAPAGEATYLPRFPSFGRG
jgi:hypothetical protein